jgi:hypothetical protein
MSKEYDDRWNKPLVHPPITELDPPKDRIREELEAIYLNEKLPYWLWRAYAEEYIRNKD